MTLLTEIESTIRRRKIAPSRFGRDCAGDPRLVFDLKRGRQPGAGLEDRIRQHLKILSIPGVETAQKTTYSCIQR